MNFVIQNEQQIKKVVQEIKEKITENRIVIFEGAMGAGKTTFIKHLCVALGVDEIVNSPTFAIVNEYETNKAEIIYHFDCYRISKIEEAINIGILEYLESGNMCFIEWAENIAPLLPEQYLKIEIIVGEENNHNIIISEIHSV